MMRFKALTAVQLLAMTTLACSQGRGLPPEFQRLLPKGRIAAINDPVFVSADRAGIDGKSWVLGVVVNGQSKAYSLNLLNSHEVVNDVVGDKPVSAVW